jgi:hypothetical protein
VLVTDPDDVTWRGRITVPSVLWTGWWVVNPLTAQRGRTGKTGARHVHESEMKILWEAKNEPA